jgi:S-(hydroxymethyl)mycothiol dehydrogenase
MTTIDATGVVVRAAGADPRLEPILVDDPGPGEIRVAVTANGLCHSDHWAIANGNWGAPWPMLLGHEGTGVIEAIGPGVDGLEPGLPVLLTWAMPCGTCASCVRDRPRRCAHSWSQPPRMRTADGEPLTGTLSLGTFATHVVVHAAQAVPLPAGLDPVAASLLGCGASTGVGAAVNTGEVQPGDTVAVIGLGGIGLAAVQGARIAGAARIVAVDLVAAKLETAIALGATDGVDAAAVDAVAVVRSRTGGVDVALEATGVAAVVAQAVAMLGRGGTAVAIGVPAPSSDVTLAWGEGSEGAAYPNKIRLTITDGGDPVPEDFAAWLGWAADGRLDLGAMVTRVAPLTDGDLRDGLRAMLAGEVVRTVYRVDGAPLPGAA